MQPTRAYFGQKDIQQALLLRRMLLDLHVPAPLSHNLVILPTFRDSASHLALSSRNAYLSASERPFATVLVDALEAAQRVWDAQRGSTASAGAVRVGDVLAAASSHVAAVVPRAKAAGVYVSPLYFALNDPEELGDLEGEVQQGRGAILSGAVMLGRTRLIDNLVFDYELNPRP